MTERLGTYIRELRKKRGWTQVELADRAGVPKQTVNRLETGTTKLPGALIRRQIAGALGVEHIDLLIAAGEISAEEANLPEDSRSEAVRRLQPVIDSIHWNEDAFRLIEGSLEYLLALQTGRYVEPVASWENEE